MPKRKKLLPKREKHRVVERSFPTKTSFAKFRLSEPNYAKVSQAEHFGARLPKNCWLLPHFPANSRSIPQTHSISRATVDPVQNAAFLQFPPLSSNPLPPSIFRPFPPFCSFPRLLAFPRSLHASSPSSPPSPPPSSPPLFDFCIFSCKLNFEWSNGINTIISALCASHFYSREHI